MEAIGGYLRQLIDLNPHFIFVKDRQGRYTFVNAACAHLFNTTPDQLVGKTDADVGLNPEEVASFRRDDLEVMETLREKLIPLEVITNANGEVRYLQTIKRAVVDADGVARFVLGIATDITAQKKAEDARRALEAQMLHVQKLDSLGLLAGGIAHDFNNLLVGVLTNADVALRKLGAGSPAAGSIEQIRVAAMRAAELCHQMLAYTGRGDVTVEVVDLDDIVRELAQLMRASVHKSALVRTELAARLPRIAGDPTQLRQVVMNLITNASDALGGLPGSIAVSTGVRELTAEDLEGDCTKQRPPPGRYAHVEVTDTGCGMSPETIARMFDPFFTTKISGRGLGLAAVLGIVRSHRGAILVRSAPGKGTTCGVHLPVSEPLAAAAPAAAAVPVPVRDRAILVIDDEPIVLGAVREILELEGYAVTTAHGGHEGIELYRRRATDFAGVLLDVTMPGLGGAEVVRELRMIRPDVRVILMSGYERTRPVLDEPAHGFLQKPFRSEDLLHAVAKLLA
ncbi:MAG: response regulator [Deltaproteobacteria bacterium]|nr:response regulator [Deltaproteobacteria bacterium]MCW5805920.1 response regulator [Deltaproteobacteria bacterium]